MKLISYFKGKIRPAFLIFFAAFLIRALHLAASKEILSFEFRLNDGIFFDALATALVQGVHNTNQPVVGLSPAYVGFLFFFQKLFGHDLLWPRLAQIILGSFSCVGLYQIARSLFGGRAGWIAGLLAAFCGIFIYFDMILIKASLANSLLIFFFWIFQRSLDSPVRAVSAGAALMAGCMLRMQLVMTLPWVMWVWMQTAWQKRKPFMALGLILFFVGMIATQVFFGVWFKSIMSRTQGVPPAEEVAAPQSGIHFYMGNHPHANGTYVRVEGIRPSAVGHVVDTRKIAEKNVGHSLNMREVNTFWMGAAVRTINLNPGRWLVLEAKKFFLIWNSYEIPNSQHYDYWRKFSPVLSMPLVSCGWLIPLALLGWIRLRKDSRPMIQLLKGFAVSYIVSLLLTFVTADYRLPLYPVWIIFAAFALDRVWVDLMEKRFDILKRMAVIFLLFFIFCNYETYLNKQNYNVNMQKRMNALMTSFKPRVQSGVS